jgi:hypothetical protein
MCFHKDMIVKPRTLLQILRIRPNNTFSTLSMWPTMKANIKYMIRCYFFSKINLIIYWWFFIAIEPAEPPVGPVNQWASRLSGSLTGSVF